MGVCVTPGAQVWGLWLPQLCDQREHCWLQEQTLGLRPQISQLAILLWFPVSLSPRVNEDIKKPCPACFIPAEAQLLLSRGLSREPGTWQIFSLVPLTTWACPRSGRSLYIYCVIGEFLIQFCVAVTIISILQVKKWVSGISNLFLKTSSYWVEEPEQFSRYCSAGRGRCCLDGRASAHP